MWQERGADLLEVIKPIALNLSRANDYLDQSPFKFESDGSTAWDRNKAASDGSYMRYDDQGRMLVINHGAANAAIGAVIEIEMLRNAPLVGIQYNFQVADFSDMLDEYYMAIEWEDQSWNEPTSERFYSTFSMGVNFAMAYDPYYSWHSDWLMAYYNSTGLVDDILDDLIVKMRRTEPGDLETYLEHWFNYQVRWNQLLPVLPLYANETFNLFSARLSGVNTTPFHGWSMIICGISKN
jgi:peptide/nickel transport system substrate-binding protein